MRIHLAIQDVMRICLIIQDVKHRPVKMAYSNNIALQSPSTIGTLILSASLPKTT